MSQKSFLPGSGADTDAAAEALREVECPVTEEHCSLCCLPPGQKGRVALVAGPNRCRLMEMGFTRGTEVEVARRAAFGGPMLIKLRSYHVSLRRDEAESIRINTTEPETP
ncbi:MAG: hypothetical protein OHK0029_21320 [Armatimonadaceae bacterium]